MGRLERLERMQCIMWAWEQYQDPAMRQSSPGSREKPLFGLPLENKHNDCNTLFSRMIICPSNLVFEYKFFWNANQTMFSYLNFKRIFTRKRGWTGILPYVRRAYLRPCPTGEYTEQDKHMYRCDKTKAEINVRNQDQLRFLRSCPPTPPLNHNFTPSEKLVLMLA